MLCVVDGSGSLCSPDTSPGRDQRGASFCKHPCHRDAAHSRSEDVCVLQLASFRKNVFAFFCSWAYKMRPSMVIVVRTPLSTRTYPAGWRVPFGHGLGSRCLTLCWVVKRDPRSVSFSFSKRMVWGIGVSGVTCEWFLELGCCWWLLIFSDLFFKCIRCFNCQEMPCRAETQNFSCVSFFLFPAIHFFVRWVVNLLRTFSWLGDFPRIQL